MTLPSNEALLRLAESVAEAATVTLTEAGIAPTRVTGVRPLVDYEAVATLVPPGTVVADASSVDGVAGRALLLVSQAMTRRFLDRRPGEEPADADADADADPTVDAEAEAAEAAPGANDPPGAEAATAEPAPEAAPDSAAAPEVDAEAAAAPDSGAAAEAGDAEPPPGHGARLVDESELGRLRATAERINESIAGTLSMLLGQTITYEPPSASIVDDPRFIVRPGPVQALCVSLTAAGVEMTIVQFAPNALVMRAAKAFEELADEVGPLGEHGPSPETLSDITVRVWAELGRTELALADALALPLGAVVELDRDAEAPIDLFVNGVSFGSGRLTVTDDGEWALVLDEVGPATAARAAA